MPSNPKSKIRNPKSKIVLVGPTYPFRGGISHYTTLLCQHLRERHTVRFFTFRRQYPAWLYPGQSDRDPSESVPLRVEAEPWLDGVNPWTWWRVAWAIGREQPERLVVQWSVPFWGPMLLLLVGLARRGSPRTRVVLLCHNATPHEPGGSVMRRATGWMQATLARWSDLVICHSQPDRETMQQHAPDTPARVVMLPSYAALAPDELPPQAEARSQLGLGAGPVLLFFGLVRPYKGVDLLFEAMPRVLQAFPDATLVVAGEWWPDALPAREALERLDLGDHVRLLDKYLPNEQLPSLFAAADGVVLPYRSATQSAVVQLAFGFGVPVITTAVGGLPEAVEHERSGLIVPPNDPDALADAIVRYLREGWRARLEPGVAAARTRFSWAAMVEAIESAGPTP